MNQFKDPTYHQILNIFISIVFAFFAYLMLELSLPYLSFDNTIEFLASKQNVIHLDYWRIAFYTHVFTSIFILVVGFPQFFPKLLEYKKLHRLLGKIYVFLILVVSAPAGFVMAWHANGGIVAQIGFSILAILWWGMTYQAYQLIRARNINRHKEFMIRSFALTLSAVTLRSWVFILAYATNLESMKSYIIVAWLSWLPNLLVAEWIIRRRN